VPGIIEASAAAEAAGGLADDHPVLADGDAIGIGLDLDRPAHRSGGDGVLVVVEANEAGFGDGSGHRVEAIEPARRAIGNRHQLRPLRLKHLPDRPIGDPGMLVRLGEGNAAVEQQRIQLLVAAHPQSWREEPPAHQPDLVLHLPLLPPRRRRACHRLDQIMAAHLQEAAVELPCRRTPSPTAVFIVS